MSQVGAMDHTDPKAVRLSNHIDQFLVTQQKLDIELNSNNLRQNQTLFELIEGTPELPPEIVDLFFEQEFQSFVNPSTVTEVKQVFSAMRNRLNSFAPKKRFYILETMDFFSSKISIGKLIPALLVLEGAQQQKAIAEFIKPTFLSINKNVEILASTNEIFDPKSIHLDRGSLYTLVSDIARILIELFEPSYLESFEDINSHVELMLRVMASNPIFNDKVPGHDSHMSRDSDIIRKVVLEFVSTIQSHEALYNYALKRHGYYKLFLSRLTSGRRFGGVAPYEVSRVFAGCLLGNGQLPPSASLIAQMVDEDGFSNHETLIARKQFVDQLSPTVVYKLISDIKINLQTFSQTNLNNAFGDVTRLSVKNILKRVWTSFIAFGEQIRGLLTEPFKVIFSTVKQVYRSFIIDESNQHKALTENGGSPELDDGEPIKLIDKDDQAILALESFQLVKTDIVAFRGEFEGASQKDYGYNARLFKQDELLILRFKSCFERLFIALEQEEHLYVIRFQAQHKIRQYYGAFQFGDRILCLGLTHQKQSSLTAIQQKDIFPYTLLFSEAKDKAFGRVLSRSNQDTGQIFNEESLTANNAKVFYEGLYILLHLLPEKDWNSIECQTALKFLVEELEKVTDPKSLIFLGPTTVIPT